MFKHNILARAKLLTTKPASLMQSHGKAQFQHSTLSSGRQDSIAHYSLVHLHALAEFVFGISYDAETFCSHTTWIWGVYGGWGLRCLPFVSWHALKQPDVADFTLLDGWGWKSITPTRASPDGKRSLTFNKFLVQETNPHC